MCCIKEGSDSNLIGLTGTVWNDIIKIVLTAIRHTSSITTGKYCSRLQKTASLHHHPGLRFMQFAVMRKLIFLSPNQREISLPLEINWKGSKTWLAVSRMLLLQRVALFCLLASPLSAEDNSTLTPRSKRALSVFSVVKVRWKYSN